MPTAPTLSASYYFTRPTDPLGNLPNWILNPNQVHIKGIAQSDIIYGDSIDARTTGDQVTPVGFMTRWDVWTAYTADRSIPTEGGTTIVDINNKWQLLGNYYSLNKTYYDLKWGQLQSNQFIFDALTQTTKVIHTGNPLEKAIALNDAGYVIGSQLINNKLAGFIRNDGPGAYFKDLDFSPLDVNTRLSDINNQNQVTGFYLNSDNTTHSFIYYMNENQYVTYDVRITNSSGQQQRSNYTAITSINDAGTFVGIYTDANGNNKGFANLNNQTLKDLASYLGIPATQNNTTNMTIDNKGRILFDTVDQFGDTYHYLTQSYRVLSGINSESGNEIYCLYKAAFNRMPDADGLAWWITNYTNGAFKGLNQVASVFLNSVEFNNLYGQRTQSDYFVIQLYENALQREPDEGGLNYWMGKLQSGLSREDMLIAFSQSTENLHNVSSNIQNGYWVL